MMQYDDGKGWHSGRIVPYAPLSMDPACCVLHYAQAVFDGLKAFRGADGQVRLFRVDQHAARLNRSCEQLCIPPLDQTTGRELYRRASSRPIEDWVATQARHLALHPPDRDRHRDLPRRAPVAQLPLLRDPQPGRRLLQGGPQPGEASWSPKTTSAPSPAASAAPRPPATTPPASPPPATPNASRLHPGALPRRPLSASSSTRSAP